MLKLKAALLIIVAPPAGAWIETRKAYLHGRSKRVAPPAGAWIETVGTKWDGGRGIGRAPCGRVD